MSLTAGLAAYLRYEDDVLGLQFPEAELIATYLICNVQINTDIGKSSAAHYGNGASSIHSGIEIQCVAHRQVFYSIIIPLCTGKEAIRSLSEGQSVPACSCPIHEIT